MAKLNETKAGKVHETLDKYLKGTVEVQDINYAASQISEKGDEETVKKMTDYLIGHQNTMTFMSGTTALAKNAARYAMADVLKIVKEG